ncbi:inverse autotransporter beta domain-containing protein, partial [Yersinia enterocolitica]|nr:LysM peptidoglycan-binding domain-containing protein [Yersinia enterocolitica]EKN5104623.1 LysM peptidoglycan-binding domain-containing protein [Yersinia enterocolitica]
MHNDYNRKTSTLMAWVNIITQLLFPLAGAFTPSIVAAKEKQQDTPRDSLMAQPAVPYTLKSGETVNVVARRHGLTVSQLKRINQFRTFSRPFSALQTGTEIDVPDKNVRSKTSLLFKSASTDPEQQVAKTASQVGNMLNAEDTASAAQRQIRSLAVATANKEVQDWLNGFGTTRVQGNLDDRGRLEGSQFDMLLPLYNTKDRMFFTQLGLRRLDSRTTANIGLGQRHFMQSWMLGYNTFLDHDMTRNHTRMGVGLEYVRDYLKLGANGYLRLSGWHNSPDLDDYSERPANGFDVRADAYLPPLPQLGGRLMYEQYYGDEVALFGLDKRQKNPGALTAGISYTPFPLVTVGIDRKQGSSGQGETLFNVSMNYAFGTPWKAQINSDAVAVKRSLQGLRNSLVERNNQIVLEYQKQETIRLTLASRITGTSKQSRPLGVNITTKYGLKNIVWDDVALLAGGGKVLGSYGNYTVMLPDYQRTGNNTYILAAVAYDNKGNASNRDETQVTVLPGAISLADSHFVAPQGVKPDADGRTTTTLTLTLKDDNGNPLTKQAEGITLTASSLTGNGTDPHIAGAVEVSPGVYEIVVTSGTKIGTMTLTPAFNGTHLPPAAVTFVPTPVLSGSTHSIPVGSLPADGTTTTTITLALKDVNGNPLTGHQGEITFVTNPLSGSGTHPQIAAVVEVSPGIYEAIITAGTNTGTLTVTPWISGVSMDSKQINLIAVVSPGSSTTTAANGTLEANGTASTTLTLTLKDVNGQPLIGHAGHITLAPSTLAGNGTDPQLTTVTEVSPGVYTAVIIAGTKMGPLTITPTIFGAYLTSTVVNFTAVISGATSTVGIASANLPANGVSTTILTLTLKDINGQPLSGQLSHILLSPSVLAGNGTDPQLTTVTEVGPGIYEAVVTAGTKTGPWTVISSVNDVPLDSVTVSFTPEVSPSSSTSSAANANLPADGNTTTTLTFTLLDNSGSPLVGQVGHLSLSTSALAGSGIDPQLGEIVEISPGVYTAVLTAGTKTGHITVTPAINGANLTPVAVNFAPVVAPAGSTYSLATGTLPADGTATTTLTLTLKDINGNPLSGQQNAITLVSTALNGSGSTPQLGAVTEVSPGVYEAVVTSGTQTGIMAITPWVGGTPLVT